MIEESDMEPSVGANDRIAILMRKYADTVYRICFIYLGDRPEVEDVFQEVFVKLFRNNSPFSSEEHEKAWLIRVTINQCKDIVKGFWWKRIDLLEQVKLPAHDPEERDVLLVVMSLPQKYKDVIYLYYYQDYTVPEISQMLQRSENTIYSQLHRARDLVRRKLEGKGYEGTF
jgi:RNA polymerase sigma factor (sigma-70 family)